MIGKTLFHYRVLEEIRQGGMGKVYRAEDTNLSREVAIEVLPDFLKKDLTAKKRFLSFGQHEPPCLSHQKGDLVHLIPNMGST